VRKDASLIAVGQEPDHRTARLKAQNFAHSTALAEDHRRVMPAFTYCRLRVAGWY
jgi:hypothetical protein